MNAAQGSAGEQNARISGTVPWCSGLAYVPVKDEIAGSNPVGTALDDERVVLVLFVRVLIQYWPVLIR